MCFRCLVVIQEPMKAFFTRAENDLLGLRFEPVTFEEQLLLEMFTQRAFSEPHEFQFSSWETNHPRTLRKGLTSCWGQLIRRSERTPSTSPAADGVGAEGPSLSEPTAPTAPMAPTTATVPSTTATAPTAPIATTPRGTGGALSEAQRRVLVQFREARRVIGAYDVLGCAIEAELVALDLGVSPNARAWHRAEIEKYLARLDAEGRGRGRGDRDEALRALLAAGAPGQARQAEILTWVAVFDCSVGRSVTWHATHAPLQLDDRSEALAPETILTLCGRTVPCHHISRTSRSSPEAARRDRPCGHCAPAEAARWTAARSIANECLGPSVTQALREALDKWQGLAEGSRSLNFQPPRDQKLLRELERIAVLRQLLNTEEPTS